MLGRIASARTTAISEIEKKCGQPGDVALDGKAISSFASNDFTESQIAGYIDAVGCSVEKALSSGYGGAKSDLARFTARASFGGNALDTYFPCLGP